MDLALFGQGLLLGFSIAAPVGPIGILCIRRTLSESRASGFASGLGAATADALYGCVAAFGLTIVSELLVKARAPMAWGGGAFLLWIGWRTMRARPPELGAAAAAGAAPSLWSAWASTFLLTVTNPMTILSFVAVFAGLGLGSRAHGPAAAVALVAGVFGGSAAWWFALSGSVSLLRARFTTGGLAWVNRISGAVLIAFGVVALLVAGGAVGAGR
ncbi:MAG TPA: LysE family translocator [Candidatus Eisenbacteria bacterium]|nr:LysE family translocator [Candidatus Eisenbacteria bacterium]